MRPPRVTDAVGARLALAADRHVVDVLNILLVLIIIHLRSCVGSLDGTHDNGLNRALDGLDTLLDRSRWRSALRNLDRG